MKIYRYRPLSDILFKELLYQEIYFSSYEELNDPLDMLIQIDFNTSEIKSINYLFHFIGTCQFIHNNSGYNEIYKYDDLKIRIFEKIKIYSIHEKISLDTIIRIIENSIKELNSDFCFDNNIFKSEIIRLCAKFFKKSYVSCFSETNDNFLMWSHYASRHTGICLEFTLKDRLFPFESVDCKNKDSAEYQKGMARWDGMSFNFLDEIKQVQYQEILPRINFFDFSYIFSNEYDCDVESISKSWVHSYANKIRNNLLVKMPAWRYEKEWRIVDVNFETNKYPEDKIRYYPLECLTGVYFGINTPSQVKNRIIAIMESKHNCKIKYYESQLKDSFEINFQEKGKGEGV